MYGRARFGKLPITLQAWNINTYQSFYRRVVTQNWLLNPTGKTNAFVEIDLVQEHLNFWIKVSFTIFQSSEISSLTMGP